MFIVSKRKKNYIRYFILITPSFYSCWLCLWWLFIFTSSKISFSLHIYVYFKLKVCVWLGFIIIFCFHFDIGSCFLLLFLWKYLSKYFLKTIFLIKIRINIAQQKIILKCIHKHHHSVIIIIISFFKFTSYIKQLYFIRKYGNLKI